jgi:homoserine kinase type II
MILLRGILEYDLGEAPTKKTGAYRHCFAIQTIKDGQRRQYFLRKYKTGIREPEIQFEHSLINHLVEVGAPPVARLHRTREGDTFVRQFAGAGDQEGVFFAIFDFLPGEDRYTWVGPRCSAAELHNSAVVLAQFHNAVSGFQPQGQRAEAKIFDLLPQIAAGVAACPTRTKNTAFDACLLERGPALLQDIAATQAVLSEPEALALPQLVVHCDYHPGNLKFSGSQVTGLFVSINQGRRRCLDVASALWYFLQPGTPPGRRHLEGQMASPSGSQAF